VIAVKESTVAVLSNAAVAAAVMDEKNSAVSDELFPEQVYTITSYSLGHFGDPFPSQAPGYSTEKDYFIYHKRIANPFMIYEGSGEQTGLAWITRRFVT